MSTHESPEMDRLTQTLHDLGRFALAFSGGLDSRFLAHAALLAGIRPELIHVRGPHVAPGDSAWAARWAAARGLPLRVLDADPLSLPDVAQNSPERCYACKAMLFTMLRDAAGALTLCDGSNASDELEYRPGRRALRELNVRSPLAESGLTKDALRALGRATGLERPGQQARACLLTRLPYGMAPDRGTLARIAGAEAAVEALLTPDHAHEPPQFRLRVLAPDRMELHVQLPELSPALRDALAAAVRREGLECAAVEAMERIQGFHDRNRS